jgi:hypothetical protein
VALCGAACAGPLVAAKYLREQTLAKNYCKLVHIRPLKQGEIGFTLV